ncbi:MAG TPA: PfkB family carbohydrate kinase, partial [Limnochordia bacterium]|nr:PfkB family carbohydrate kinase [Limnochordia bacterium]
AGANGRVGAADLKRARGALAEADVIVTQLEIPLPAVEQLAELARELGRRLILNPAPAPAGPLPEAVMASAYLVTPNESEAERMSGIRVDGAAGAARAAAELRRQGAGRVIITLGGQGLYGLDESGEFHLTAHRVDVVDTVGAGDAFTGALAAALAEGQSLAAGCRFATAAAALSVTQRGAQDAMPARPEIERFMAEHP